MKKTAILQSNYIPWKGYFDLINSVDEFVLYDDVQYTKNDWRNRNKIKTNVGSKWLTIPVITSGKIHQKIKDTRILDTNNWGRKHWSSICQNYSKSKYFCDYKEIFEELYLNSDEEYLSKINYKFIKTINNILGINTKISFSSDYELIDGQTERLINICKQAKAVEYISGPAAKVYINEPLFQKENIKLTWMDYNDYEEYEQLYPPFDHYVSILDLIFNEGSNAVKLMKSFGESS